MWKTLLLSNFGKESGRREWIAKDKHANKRENETMVERRDSWIFANAGAYRRRDKNKEESTTRYKGNARVVFSMLRIRGVFAFLAVYPLVIRPLAGLFALVITTTISRAYCLSIDTLTNS